MNKNSLLGIMMQDIPLLPNGSLHGEKVNSWDKMKETLHSIVEELLAPPTVASVCSHRFLLLILIRYN